MARKKVFITPTTHWDREWILTFGEFQVRLVNLMDNLIAIMEEYPDYRFLMDGQAIILEDYLEIMPDQREYLSSFLRKGQLIAGPWYVLADQFLENGESTIRNLLFGKKTIEDLGGSPMKLGYIPDSFGSIATMPMILNGFNISYAAFGRGRPYSGKELPSTEFLWRSPDESEVLTASHGYGNGIFLSYLDIWTNIMEQDSLNPAEIVILNKFLEEAKKQECSAATSNLYFSVGLDHMEPRKSLPSLVKYINMHQKEYQLVYGMPEDYLKAVEEDAANLSRYLGEMRGSEKNEMDLVGTLSSHMPLKQANDNCEILLQRVVEPLWNMVINLTSAKYPKGHIRKMWKLLLENQPHDSICGCSIDKVHSDMMNRYEQIQTISDYLIKDGMHRLLDNIDTTNKCIEAVSVTIVSPLGYDYTGPVSGLIRVPKRFVFDSYVLFDSEDNVIPAKIKQVVSKQKDLESVYMTNKQLSEVISKDAGVDVNDDQVFTVLEVDFVAEAVPGIGYKTYWLKKGKESNNASVVKLGMKLDMNLNMNLDIKSNMKSNMKLNKNGMENEYLGIILNENGTIDLTYKITGLTYYGLNYFVDREDTGNSYDYHGFKIPQEINSKTNKVHWNIFENELHKITYSVVIPMEIPDNVEGDARSNTVKTIFMTVYTTLYAHADRLDISVEMNNLCKDHCLRVAFDSGLNARNISAYDHFNVIERKIKESEKDWRDEPFQEFVDISDPRNGLCISTKGLPAYEAVDGKEGVVLYLTLLRSVGRLGPAAGADYPVPGAQCIGNHKFEYSIIPHFGNWVQGDCLVKATNYRAQILVEGDIKHEGPLPATNSFIKIGIEKGMRPYISCMKQAEDGNGIILRLWNPGNERKIKFENSFGANKLELIGLDERGLDETITSNEINVIDGICLKAKGLTSLRISK